MCSLEWLGRLKCRATGLDASLSSFSTSRRCSRNQSPNRLPVSQPQKSGAKIHLSNRHPQSPRHQRTLFIQLIYSCFSRYQVPTNSVAPSSVYKAYTTHNSSICSDEGLTLETSAFQSLYGGQFTNIINSVDKPNFRIIILALKDS